MSRIRSGIMQGEKPASATPIVIVDIVFPRLYLLLPTPAKAPVSAPLRLASFHQIGLSVGKGFEWQMRDELTKRDFVRAAKAAQQIIESKWAAAGETAMVGIVRSQADVPVRSGLRSALTKYEVGARLSNEVLYPNTSVDEMGEAITGARNYELNFEADKLPTVSVFLEPGYVRRRHAFCRKRLWTL
jgi:hypothetical protein